ncbi:ATP-binding cassette domain-containing protein [Streptomyces sp. RS10V-4]|uniref:ABC transporter ATP-binding protein n=1 Tax=Streptomyces rhizoryzae TaxID=2932493 RepID=UPI002002ED8B|nr:ATP-binding cassette domain-containing protein [Streptomyces rhizoryzae]MCK7622412.1 ATP-binding cassette domain-containing protein [Streptomyces rhizoryzae]
MSLQFTQCTYRYGRQAPVLDRLDLTVDHRATVLLGPNGAGKSTLLGIAASWILPAQGSVTWRGIDPARAKTRAAYRKAVGWLPQHAKPMPGLTVRENVAYTGWLKGMNRTDAWAAAKDALARVELGGLAERKSHQLSGGQLRRMGIAGTLVHRSEIVLLDEPTAGLDPSQRHVFRDLAAQLVTDVRLVISTHQTEDLDTAYDHVVLLDQGRVRFHGATEDFLRLAGPDAPAGRRAEAAYTRLIGKEA